MFNPFKDDEDQPRYDDEGNLVYIPEGWAVEYLVSAEGYFAADYQRVSELVYGGLGATQNQILSALDLPTDTGLYMGYGIEAEYSLAATPLRKTDIPETARFMRED